MCEFAYFITMAQENAYAFKPFGSTSYCASGSFLHRPVKGQRGDGRGIVFGQSSPWTP